MWLSNLSSELVPQRCSTKEASTTKSLSTTRSDGRCWRSMAMTVSAVSAPDSECKSCNRPLAMTEAASNSASMAPVAEMVGFGATSALWRRGAREGPDDKGWLGPWGLGPRPKPQADKEQMASERLGFGTYSHDTKTLALEKGVRPRRNR